MKVYERVRHPYTGRMIPKFLTGVITPLFTPCKPDNSLDHKGIAAMVRWLKGTGAVTTLFPRSGVGGMYTFSYSDVKEIIDVVVSEAAGDVFVMPGTAGIYDRRGEKPDPERYTSETIELSLYAQERGADAAVIVMPSALRREEGVPLEETIFRYFERVHGETELPIVIYNPPGLEEEYRMTPGLLGRLLKLERIWGLKYSTTDMGIFTGLAMASEGTDFGLIAGAEHAYLYVMICGGLGVIGQGCGINPQILRAVYDRFMEGDIEGARQAQLDVLRALQASRSMPSALAGMYYFRSKGVEVPLNARNVRMYEGGPGGEVDEGRVREMVEAIDSLVSKYV